MLLIIGIITLIMGISILLLMYKTEGAITPAIVRDNANICTNCGHEFEGKRTHCPKCAVKLFYNK